MNSRRLSEFLSATVTWGLAALLLLVPVYFAWFQENFSVFDLNKSALLRAGLLIISAAWLAKVSFEGRFSYVGNRKLLWLLGFWAAAVSLSTVCSLHPGISFTGTYERQQGLYNLLSYALFCALIITTLKNAASVRRCIVALLLGGAVACLYGVMQVLGLDFLRWAENTPRIFSSFGQPNFFGHYLVVLLPLTVYAFFHIGRRVWQKAGFALLAAAELVCLFYTYSRSAWLALLAGVGFSLIWWALYRKKTAYAIALAAVALIMASMFFLPPVRAVISSVGGQAGLNPLVRLTSAFDTSLGSSRIRLLYWQSALEEFGKAPVVRKLVGYGPDVLGDVYASHYQPEWAYYEQLNTFPDRAHNTILDTLLHFGLLGLLTLGALTGWIFVRLLKYSFKAAQTADRLLAAALAGSLVMYFVNNLFSFSLTSMSVVLYGLLGIGWVVTNRDSQQIASLSFFHPFSRWIMSAGFIILLVILWWGYSLRPLIADTYYMDVKRAEVRHDCRGVIDSLDRVLSWYPQSYHYQRMYLYLGTNCFSAAGSDQSRKDLAYNLLNEAELLESGSDVQYYAFTDLAHMYSILGYYIDSKYYGPAAMYYEKMIGVNPYLTTSYQDYGRLKMWQGDSAGAIELFRKGLSVVPPFEESPDETHRLSLTYNVAYFHDLIGLAYLNDKNTDKAVEEFQLAVNIDDRMTSSHQKLAELLAEQGKFNEAITQAARGYELDPLNSLWPLQIAKIYRDKKDTTTALKYAKEALVLDPSNQEAKELLSQLER